MSWKALWISAGLALVWTAAAIYGIRAASASAAPRHFVAYQGEEQYRVDADEARVEGFCTVFIRDEVRIAAVCGQHTWSEEVER